MRGIRIAGIWGRTGSSVAQLLPRTPGARELLAVLVPVLVALGAYLPTIGFGLVWDDILLFHATPLLRDPALAAEALTGPFPLSPNYYRPLSVATFLAEIRLAGVSEPLLHVDNAILHALATGLVALLAFRVLGRLVPDAPRATAPAAAALLYGLHPALVEGVAFVSSRFDLLAALFLLLALLADGAVARRTPRAAVVATCFLLAALSKESAAALFVVLPLWHAALGTGGDGRAEDIRLRDVLPVYAALAAAAAVYLALRAAALGQVVASSATAGGPVSHALLVGLSLGGYLRLAFWPFGAISPVHAARLPVPLGDPLALTALAAAVAVLTGLVVLARRASRPALLGLASLAALLPVANLVPLENKGGMHVAERYLVFPLALLAVALTPSVARLLASAAARRAQAIRVALGALVATYAATIAVVLPRWRSELDLWTWAAERAPKVAFVRSNLAVHLSAAQRLDEAATEATAATELDPGDANAWNIAGLVRFRRGDIEGARAAFERSVAIDPEPPLPWSNLAAMLREQGDLAGSIRVLSEEALPRGERVFEVHLNIALTCLAADRPDLARPAAERAIALADGETERHRAAVVLSLTEEPGRWLRLAGLLLANAGPGPAGAALDRAAELGAPLADVERFRAAARAVPSAGMTTGR